MDVFAHPLESETPEAMIKHITDAFGKEVAAIVKRAETAEPDTAWLVERPGDDNSPPRWWHPKIGWCIDANKALRFCRKKDAEDYIGEMRFAWGSAATEHRWI